MKSASTALLHAAVHCNRGQTPTVLIELGQIIFNCINCTRYRVALIVMHCTCTVQATPRAKTVIVVVPRHALISIV